MSKLIKKEYKDYTIIIEEQKPSVTKPQTEEEWDKHFETYGGETKGTHRYKVIDKEEVIINEDDTEMWDTQACLDNAMADIEAEIKQKLGGTHG
jgi:hypothetical protein